MTSKNGFRIKEWNYYLIYNNKNGIAITIDDNSYMSLNSVTLFDYEHHFQFSKLSISSKVDDVKVKARTYSIDILNDGNERIMNAFIKNFKDGKDVKVNLILYSMVITTPFHGDTKAFYYNQKIIGFHIKGNVYLGKRSMDIS